MGSFKKCLFLNLLSFTSSEESWISLGPISIKLLIEWIIKDWQGWITSLDQKMYQEEIECIFNSYLRTN